MTDRAPRVFIADDDPNDQLLVTRALKKASPSVAVGVASDGGELLTLLRDAPQGAHPDVILLDLNMPGMDGRTTLSALKSDPVLRALPVVIMTTSCADKDRIDSMHLGANAFLRKPVSLKGIRAVARVVAEFWLLAARGLLPEPPTS